jgi:bifunctional enzyme CysN/CysC
VLAINKMDLVGYSQRPSTHRRDYRAFAAQIGLSDITSIPMSALKGDNITDPPASAHALVPRPHADGLSWKRCEIDESACRRRLPPAGAVGQPPQPRLPRLLPALIAGGVVKPGDRIRVQPSGRESTVARIVTLDGDLSRRGRPVVTLTLADEIDISRGDVISRRRRPGRSGRPVRGHLVWMHDEPMLPGRPYLLKIGTPDGHRHDHRPKYKVNVNTLEHWPPSSWSSTRSACATSRWTADRLRPYADNRDTGGFILIDRLTNNTVGAGMLHFALRRAHNIHLQPWTSTRPRARR